MDITGIGAVATLATDLVDKIFPDKVAQAKEREAYLLQAQTLDDQLAIGQAAIDQVEAANNNLFVSGWRPFVGWCCGIAFAYHLILQPLAAFVMANTGHVVSLPDFDTSTLTTTLMGILGLGVMRTGEKMGEKGHLPWQQGSDDSDK